MSPRRIMAGAARWLVLPVDEPCPECGSLAAEFQGRSEDYGGPAGFDLYRCDDCAGRLAVREDSAL